MKLAFIYNIRKKYPDPNDPESHRQADYDDPLTIKWIIKHLKNLNFEVIPIEANEKACLKLYKFKNDIDLVLNYSLGINGKDRYAHIPAICEMLKLPYTGQSPLVAASIMNKKRAKEILLANNLPTLPYQVFKTQNEKLKKDLKFPLIVKPIAQGSSAGITNKSVVKNVKELKRQIRFILKTFNEPALVEPFLDGREFSISMLGNPPQILPIIESDHSLLPKKFLPLDSLEVKWIFEEKGKNNNLICPAKISRSLRKTLEEIALKTWRVLEIADLCRIDIRCDNFGNPFVLEINSPPGLIPPEVSNSSYFPLSARTKGISYEKLLKKIIFSALKRYKLKTSIT